VLCIDIFGNTLPGETDPRLAVGDNLTITVWDTLANVSNKYILLQASTGSAQSSVDYAKMELPDAGSPNGRNESSDASADASADGGAANHANVTAPEAGAASKPQTGAAETDTAKARAEIHINSVPATDSLVVTLKVFEGGKNGSLVVDRPINFDVGQFGFYFEPVILFPTVFAGERTVGLSPMLGGRTSTIHVTESNLNAIQNVSLGVNIYPFGFPPTKCTTYNPGAPHGEPTAWQAIFPVACGRPYRLLALQAGVSFTNNAFREYMVGFGYTPVRGVSASWGLAFVPGQFVGPNMAEGQVVPADTVQPLNGIETKLIVRPYFAVSLSPEILQTLLSVFNAAKGLAPVHSETTGP
jgi:hypothetical protein